MWLYGQQKSTSSSLFISLEVCKMFESPTFKSELEFEFQTWFLTKVRLSDKIKIRALSRQKKTQITNYEISSTNFNSKIMVAR